MGRSRANESILETEHALFLLLDSLESSISVELHLKSNASSERSLCYLTEMRVFGDT